MLVTHSWTVNWNLAVKILAVPTLNVHLKADLPSANVPPDTAEILTQIVFVILAVQIHVVSEVSTKKITVADSLQFIFRGPWGQLWGVGFCAGKLISAHDRENHMKNENLFLNSRLFEKARLEVISVFDRGLQA